jgi:Zn-dependent peptidase ImmA (M78 family)/DNA-binding XRE family transcriptional regulator
MPRACGPSQKRRKNAQKQKDVARPEALCFNANVKNARSTNAESMQAVGDNIRALRRREHMSQGEFARRLGMRQGPVCNIEQGKNLPSAQVLLRMADVLRVTTDQILRPAGAPSPANSIHDNMNERVLVPVIRHPGGPANPLAATDSCGTPGLSVVGVVARDYLALEDLCQVPRQARIPLQLGFDLTTDALERLARQVRALFGVGQAVVFDHFELFENHGLRMVLMPLGSVLPGLAYYDAANCNVFIVINDAQNPERQIFTLVYSLGRILIHNRAGSEKEAPQGREARHDKAARRFAAAFLMPEESVRTSVRQTGVRPDEWDFTLLLRLKHRFGASAQSFNYRLLELDLIAPARQAEFRAIIDAHYGTNGFAEPGESRRILSPNGRLGDLLHTALARGDLEARDIAERLKKGKVKMP